MINCERQYLDLMNEATMIYTIVTIVVFVLAVAVWILFEKAKRYENSSENWEVLFRQKKADYDSLSDGYRKLQDRYSALTSKILDDCGEND